MKIVLLHYTYAPLVGGVENILEQHAALFVEKGHEVLVICSEGASADSAVPVVNIPEMRRDHPMVKAAQEELDAGKPGNQFAELKNRVAAALLPHFEGADVVMLHNVLTMPFHLALTVALWRLTQKLGDVRFVAWTHDLVAINPDYKFPHLDSEPWDYLKKRDPGVDYVAISELRQKQFLALTGAPPESCRVIPNGIDPVGWLSLTPPVARFAKEQGILHQEIVLLHPTRILRRKNIECGIRVLAEIKARGKSCCCIVSGPPDFHNPDTAQYHEFLMKLRAELGVAEEFVFLHELFAVTNADLAGLYRLADMLFYPSKQEGFGLPMLEGALHRMPIFSADIEPMKSLSQGNATFFDPNAQPGEIADAIIARAAASEPIQSRKTLVRDYSWDTLYPRLIEPLLKGKAHH